MSTSDEIAAELAAAADKIKAAEEFLAPIEAELHSILAEKMALQEAYHKSMELIKQKQIEIDNKKYQAYIQVNYAKAEEKELEQKLAQMKAAEEAEAKRKEREAVNAELTARFDQLTMSAKWREWAKDHQIEAGKKITEDMKVILADPMGLGKTLSAIIAIEMIERATKDASPEFPFLGEEQEVFVGGGYDENNNYVAGHYETQIVNSITRPVGRRILYLCPAALLRNVLSEFREWAPHRNVNYIGGMTKAERNFVFDMVYPMADNYVTICNYEAWRKDKALITKFIETDYDTVIIDEAHNAKDPKSIVYRGIKELLDHSKPEYVIPMTGTPILNRPQELFSLLTFVNPTEFYRLNDFLFNFCEQDKDTGQWKFQYGGLERVAKKIRKNFLRRTKDQAGIVLPEKTIIHHDLEVDTTAYPNQARVRKEMRDYAAIKIGDKAIGAAAMIAVFTRLRQVETWPAGIKQHEYGPDANGKNVIINTVECDVEESQKVDYVIRYEDGEWNGLIPDTVEDERIVLFSQFKAPLREIHRRCLLAGYSTVILDGDTSDADKQMIHKDFDNKHTPNREDSKYDIVLCNYKVGGVGLNLTAATQAIILDEEWNPGKRDQAYDRIHRIGQDKPVTINVIRNAGTIDDWLAGIMEAKEDVVEGFNNTMVDVDSFKEFLDGMGDSGLI